MSRVLAFISMLFAMSQVQHSPAKPLLVPAPRKEAPFLTPHHLPNRRSFCLRCNPLCRGPGPPAR